MTRRSLVLAVGFVAVVIVYAALSRLWTDTDSEWYRSLVEPAWQPPDPVFGIVWPLNFLALLVVGVFLSWRRADVAGSALAVLSVSVLAALAWSYLFSQQHALGPAAVALVIAASLTWLLLVLVSRAGWGYAAGLLVYTVWMTLAASLSVGFVFLN
jgi:translocator protein